MNPTYKKLTYKPNLMILDIQKKQQPSKASVKVSSATYKRSPYAHSERCTAVHGANFTVIYIQNVTLFCACVLHLVSAHDIRTD